MSLFSNFTFTPFTIPFSTTFLASLPTNYRYSGIYRHIYWYQFFVPPDLISFRVYLQTLFPDNFSIRMHGIILREKSTKEPSYRVIDPPSLLSFLTISHHHFSTSQFRFTKIWLKYYLVAIRYVDLTLHSKLLQWFTLATLAI